MKTQEQYYNTLNVRLLRVQDDCNRKMQDLIETYRIHLNDCKAIQGDQSALRNKTSFIQDKHIESLQNLVHNLREKIENLTAKSIEKKAKLEEVEKRLINKEEET